MTCPCGNSSDPRFIHSAFACFPNPRLLVVVPAEEIERYEREVRQLEDLWAMDSSGVPND